MLTPGKSPRLTVTVPKGFYSLSEQTPPPAIHGKDDQGKPITLLFPGIPQSHSGPALSRLTFTAGYAVLGIELRQAEDFLAQALTLDAQYLNAWLEITGFVRGEQIEQVDANITYRLPQAQTFEIKPSLTVKIGTAYSYSPESSRQTIIENSSLAFSSPKGFSLAQCKDLVTVIRQLLHFAALEQVYMLRIDAQKEGHGFTHEDRYYPHNIELWSSILREPVESETQNDRWIFWFSDVQPRFAEFLSGWLDFSSNHQEALGCYATTVYHSLPDSVQYLCLAQALEAYHGIKFGKHDFIDRIQTLTTQFLPYLTGLVTDPSEFSKQARDNRNYYTHHDPKIKRQGRVVSRGELYRLSEKLKLIFQMCVLTEIVIPAARFSRLRRQLATHIIDYV